MSTPITIAYGDGIGPEIMDATLFILKEAEAKLAIETIEVGEKVYKEGHTSGLRPAAWESLKRTKILLKSPITTPQGGGYKSLNVTIRKTLGLFANVRPVASYAPYVPTFHPKLDMVIVRENEEDLYAGIEHRGTTETVQCLKLISRPASERISRYAFEYAVANNRKKVTCMSKDNIMKMADGMFHKVFDEVAKDYPGIETSHMIVDIGSARIASKPEVFDVIVTENLYGDIISDIAAEVSGSVGIAGSSNIGDDFAMFEAIHGSAPDIAGKGIANPSGLLQGAILMLIHIGQGDVAETIQNAWLKTLEDGIHTGDIYSEKMSKEKAGTMDFAKAVVARLGQKPAQFAHARYNKTSLPERAMQVTLPPRAKKELRGIDVFFDWPDRSPAKLAEIIGDVSALGLAPQAMSNRGLKVWPGEPPPVYLSDHLRVRYLSKTEGATITHQDIVKLLDHIVGKGLDVIKTEHLYYYDGEAGFVLMQGQ